MGDIADMMLDGTLCEGCGVYLEGESYGVPRYCSGCSDIEHVVSTPPAAKSGKVACPKCGKHVKAVGLAQHDRDRHGT